MIAVGAATAESRRGWVAVAIVWTACLAALVAWLSIASTGTLREQLKLLQPWWLDASVLLAALIGVCALARVEWTAVRRDAPIVAPVIALGVCLTVFVAPRTNRIFYDEQIYQSIGQNLSDMRLAQVCSDGTVESGRLRCAYGEYNKQPYAYPHILSLGYRVFGVHEGVAFAVNAVAMALSIAGVFMLVLALFEDRTAAFCGSLLFALIPQQIVWSATAAVEPTASLGALAAVLASAWYSRSGGGLALAALAVVSAYAIQFRPESLLVLPIVAAVAWPRLGLDLQRPRGWWGAVLFLALGAIHLGHLFAVRNIAWGTEGPRFSWTYVAGNFAANGRFYLGDERFPVIVTVLAVIGLAGAVRRRERWLMAAYFLAFFGIDLAFYAGSYNYGADVRYSLMTYPPIAVLAGTGAAAISRAIARRAPALPATAAIATVLLFQFLLYTPSIRAIPEEAWAARADVRFAKEFAAHLPADSYVLTQNPGMFHVWGIGAGQMSRAVASPNYTSWLLRQHNGGVYIHWNFWCNVLDDAQPALCRRAMALGQTTIVAEHRERDERFAFYRLTSVTP